MQEGMHLTPKYAWQNAERRLFDYFLSKLGATAGVNGYLEEYSKNVPSATDTEIWEFNLKEPAGGEQKSPQPFWSMSGEFNAFVTKRVKGQQLAGLVLSLLPIRAGLIPGIILVKFVNPPTLERATREMEADKSVGGEVRGWGLTLPLHVDFVNTEPEVVPSE